MGTFRGNYNKQSMPERPEQLGNKNWQDFDHQHFTTLSMGNIVPVLTLETLPSDYFKIRTEALMRFAPLYAPIFSRVNWDINYYYVPYRILWPGRKQDSWEFFIVNDDSVELPTTTINVANLSEDLRTPTIMEYMGMPVPPVDTSGGGFIANLTINALPIMAYIQIWDEYYRNDQLQGQRSFELVSGNNNTGLTAALPAYKPLRRNWPRDLFTSLTFQPQLGTEVLIPLVNNDFNLQSGSFDPEGPFRWRKVSDDTPADSGDTLGVEGTPLPLGHTDANGNPVYLDIQETAGTMRQLRFAMMMLEYLERAMRAGDKYRDYLGVFFKADPSPMQVDRPLWLGGKVGRVVVSEVMSTAQTEIALGSYGGQAITLDSTDGYIEYECKEHGIILGLVTVWPKPSYYQGMPKLWERRDKYDFPLEQFALIGDEAVLNRHVCFSYHIDNTSNDDEYGYNRRYWDWTYQNDIISGQFRERDSVFMSWHFGRDLDPTGTPDPMEALPLGTEFIVCRPDVERVFIIQEGEHEIYALFSHQVSVNRLLPKYGIPVTGH